MNRRIPVEAFAYYAALGVTRSYQAVADHYGVSKTAVCNLAEREHWQAQVLEFDQQARDGATKRALNDVEEMNERHLKLMKVIQAKGVEALRSIALTTAIDAVRAIDLAIRHERVIRGEPSERTEVSLEDIIRRESARWLAPEASVDAAPPASAATTTAVADPVAAEADNEAPEDDSDEAAAP